MSSKALLFDLDGTLLHSDKRISKKTLDAILKCKERGYLIGIATSRSEKSALTLIGGLRPDIFISSSGALVKYRGSCIRREEFTVAETRSMIRRARELCGTNCSIAIDTMRGDYCNYTIEDAIQNSRIQTDFQDFSKCAFRMCVELPASELAAVLSAGIEDCAWIKFLGGNWYQFAKKQTTKGDAVLILCEKSDLFVENIIAFGDDLADIGMLKLCGTGIAMGNALDEVKQAADLVIGNHDDDAIAAYLMTHAL